MFLMLVLSKIVKSYIFKHKIWTQWFNAKELKGLKGYIVIVISSKTSLVTFCLSLINR